MNLQDVFSITVVIFTVTNIGALGLETNLREALENVRSIRAGGHFVPARDGDGTATPGLVIYRFGAPLYFANAALFLDEIEQLVTGATTPIRWFVLDTEAMVDVDSTGAEVLRQAITMLTERNITFAVSRADQPFRSRMANYALLELMDKHRFYPTNRHAAAAFRQAAE
jgi:MFS superfamily sulfate permease-like transporter